MSDEIHIRGLEMPVRIGVPEEERAHWQTLTADICLTLTRGFDDMADDLNATVDYEAAANSAKALAAARPRQLLETLASELVELFLANPAITAVEVELRKRILPSVDHVAVIMRRSREG
ncbi:hypothetical protein BH11VER1_BH11VER1_22230 [soil metagenome]